MDSNINGILDQAAGKAHKAQGESFSTFLASLTTSVIILGVGVTLYLLLCSKFPNEYKIHQNSRACSLSWRKFLCPLEPSTLSSANLDKYFFERYLQILTRTFLLLALTVPPTLMPLNMVYGRNKTEGVRGLDRLSFANVGSSHTRLHWVHFGATLLVVIFVCRTLESELRFHAKFQRRHDFSRSSLLITSSMKRPSPTALRRHFKNTAGGVRLVMVNRDYRNLQAKMRQRDAIIQKLESVETRLILQTYRKHAKSMTDEIPFSKWQKIMVEDRPLIRLSRFSWLPPLPFIGPQIDAISHFSAEIARLNVEIESGQQHPESYEPLTSAMVYFNQRISGRLTSVAIAARIPPHWTLEWGTSSHDTVWGHVSASWLQRSARAAVVYLLFIALTLGFAVPITLIGSLSQMNYLSTVTYLEWINSLPSWIIASFQGVLPPLLLAVVTASIPLLIRLLANIEGLHSRRDTENHVQIYYFTFLFVQGFLNISLSAGITTIIGEMAYTLQAVPTLLARNIPKACNYFFSFIMITTITTIVSTLVNVKKLIFLVVLSPFLDKTQRQQWARAENMALQQWGTLIPVFTNVACIGLVYSTIAPLILLFTLIYFSSTWTLYRLFPPKLTDLPLGNSGLFYATALRQLFTGLYFMELCMSGLFFLVRDEENRIACLPQAIIMLVFTAVTALFQCNLVWGYWTSWNACWWRKARKENQSRNQTHDWELERWPRRTKNFQESFVQDEILSSPRPVVWIPLDTLGISDDEISTITKLQDSIWLSNESSAVTPRGGIEVTGPPPILPKKT